MNIFLDMVGCRLNQAEIEQMARHIRAAGHTIVGNAAEAELVIVNTCAVTNEAAADSRQKIRHAAREGKAKIIATGCWATLQPGQASELPHVISVVPNLQKDNLVENFVLSGESLDNRLETTEFELDPISRIPLPGLRQRTRAFIKVQDGCNNSCTFCITTVARGSARSRGIPEVITEIQAALAGGAKEIVLTGVHLGSWGLEFNLHLSELITNILKETDVPRLRLSSLEPWDLNESFFSLWADPRLCPHLHLPLQSGSEATLKRMLRKTTPTSFRNLVTAARRSIPGVAITTDIIAGFPAEDEIEFNESISFVKEMEFSGGHIFSYSPRPGTPAARIRVQIPRDVRKYRSHQLRMVLEESSVAYRRGLIGQTQEVLWEALSHRDELGWSIEGLTGNYVRVTSHAPEPRWNRVNQVRLSNLNQEGMYGEIIG